MADITFAATASSTSPQTAQLPYAAGAALACGNPVYLDASLTWQKCNTTTQAAAACAGLVAVNTVSSGQVPTLWGNGTRITGLSGLTKSAKYYVSGTGHAGGAAGGICLFADLTTNEWVTEVGTADSTTSLIVDINVLGVQK